MVASVLPLYLLYSHRCLSFREEVWTRPIAHTCLRLLRGAGPASCFCPSFLPPPLRACVLGRLSHTTNPSPPLNGDLSPAHSSSVNLISSHLSGRMGQRRSGTGTWKEEDKDLSWTEQAHHLCLLRDLLLPVPRHLLRLLPACLPPSAWDREDITCLPLPATLTILHSHHYIG